VTVHYEQPIEVYEFDVTARHAAYSGGDDGISIAQAAPWRGYTLGANETAEIRSNWRFFTARPNRWQTLVESTDGRTTERDSHALPVAVHAYPSSTPPRATRLGGHPTRLRQWGPTHDSPAERLPEHVTVDVVNESYTASHGIAVRDMSIDPGAVTVHGLVRGTQTELDEPDESVTIAESNLSASVLGSTDGEVRIHLRLETPAQANRSRSMNAPAISRSPASAMPRTRAGRRQSDSTSRACTPRPMSPNRGSIRRHPMPAIARRFGGTRSGRCPGSFALVLRFGLVIVPLAALWYAGRQLGSMPRFGGAK